VEPTEPEETTTVSETTPRAELPQEPVAEEGELPHTGLSLLWVVIAGGLGVALGIWLRRRTSGR
jgi:LPXTG-motif cell wall-anchored protein